MEEIRGNDIGMIFQDPMTSLNPTMTIGNQIMESLIKHRGMNKKEAYEEAIKMLNLVEYPNPEKRMNQYPHEFSGGMRQRAMIAIALACNPKFLLLMNLQQHLDVTIQAKYWILLKDIKEKLRYFSYTYNS